ncbi:MAG: GGDEF domain-containing protein [Lachnospiraceae bacterium]
MEDKKAIKEHALEKLRLGNIAYEEERLEEAVEYIQEAVHLFLECQEDYLYARNLNLLGVVYALIGNDSMEMDCYLNGLEFAQERKLNSLLNLFYNNIGSRYNELHQPERAKSFFKKALIELKREECKEEANYPIWMIITLMNLAETYCELGNVTQAEEKMQIGKKFMDEYHQYDYAHVYLNLQCHIWCLKNEKEKVRSHLEELLEAISNLSITRDYWQNVRETAIILRECEEYSAWERLLCMVEQTTKSQDTVYYQMLVIEMWLEYYQNRGDWKQYEHLCVKHVTLYQQQKEIGEQEKATTVDMKILLKEKEKEWKKAEKRWRKDTLTGIWNRYSLELDSKEYIRKLSEKKQLLTIGIIDIDAFKMINDTLGHIEGDKCLKAVAEILSDCLDGYGKAYRFGGDEFVVLIPEAGAKVTERIAGKIKSKLENVQQDKDKLNFVSAVTLSQGYACFYPREKDTMKEMIECADRVLYQVKRAGKNHFLILEQSKEDASEFRMNF